jgi:hypothetical protein
MICGGQALVSSSTLLNPLFQKPTTAFASIIGLVTDVEIAAGLGNTLYLAAVIEGQVYVTFSTDGGRNWKPARAFGPGANATVSDVSLAVATTSASFKKIFVVGQGIPGMAAVGPAFFSWTGLDPNLPMIPTLIEIASRGSMPFDVVVAESGESYLVTEDHSTSPTELTAYVDGDAGGLPFFSSVTFSGLSLSVGGGQLFIADQNEAKLRRFETPNLTTTATRSSLVAAGDRRRKIVSNRAGDSLLVANETSSIVVQYSSFAAEPISAAKNVASLGFSPSIGVAHNSVPIVGGVIAWTFNDQVFATRVSAP